MDQRSQMVLRTYRNTSRLVGYVLKYITIRDLKYVYPFEGLQTQIGGVSVQYRNVGPQHQHKSMPSRRARRRSSASHRARLASRHSASSARLRRSAAAAAVAALAASASAVWLRALALSSRPKLGPASPIVAS